MHINFKQCTTVSTNPRSIIRHHSIINRTWIHRGTEEEQGRGGMGRGRGPIIYHNCQQQGHYARYFPQPATTCMYCHATDHVTKECLKLMKIIQEKRNLNNQNVQWIVA
jgi:hypothetical protein